MFGFKTPEEMMAWLGRQMLVAQAEDQREPIELEEGDHWVRVIDFVPEVVVIFGKAVEEEAPGFFLASSYSEIDPEGSSAIIRSNQALMKITEDDFEAARAAGWQLLPLMLEGREFASQVMSLAGLEGDPPDSTPSCLHCGLPLSLVDDAGIPDTPYWYCDGPNDGTTFEGCGSTWPVEGENDERA